MPQTTGAIGQRSRLSQQVHPATTGRGRRATASVGPDADEDAEGEEDVEDDGMEDNGDADDQALYCFCQKMSYGEMIACDYPDCPYQWVRVLRLSPFSLLTNTLYPVPPSLCQSQASFTREMVLHTLHREVRRVAAYRSGASERSQEAVTYLQLFVISFLSGLNYFVT